MEQHGQVAQHLERAHVRHVGGGHRLGVDGDELHPVPVVHHVHGGGDALPVVEHALHVARRSVHRAAVDPPPKGPQPPKSSLVSSRGWRKARRQHTRQRAAARGQCARPPRGQGQRGGRAARRRPSGRARRSTREASMPEELDQHEPAEQRAEDAAEGVDGVDVGDRCGPPARTPRECIRTRMGKLARRRGRWG